jgi:thymidylate synthase
MNKLDKQYTDLLQDILDNGVQKKDRTGTGTISVFARQIRHNMKDGFPLLTTKKMPFKTIVTELLWFLRGDTNIKYLVDNGCNIWNGDAYKNWCKNIGKEVINQGDTFLDTKRNIIAVCKRKEIGTSKKIPILICEYEGCYIEEDCKKILTQEEFIDKIKTDDEFAKKWGELGPIYGKQWRNWKGFRHGWHDVAKVIDGSIEPHIDWLKGIDQITSLIYDLKTNPDSRRLMVNAWNVGELDQMVLPPCHYGFQVYTRELSEKERINILHTRHGNKGYHIEAGFNMLDEYDIPTRAISLMWNQRSVDTFLGLPFNIASYGLLLEIIAKEVNMVPDELIGNLGDVHLYSNHIDAAKEQIGRELSYSERWNILKERYGSSLGLNHDRIQQEVDESTPARTRQPFPLPTLKFNPCPITGISMEYQSISQFEIENYQSHPTIKAPLSN